MTFVRNLLLLLYLLLPSITFAQGSVTGQEVVISYSGTNVSIVPPNTPASNFLVNGTNTFILPVAPTVSVRLYITNNTANACGNFTLQMFSSTDNQTNTFNNALSNWQVIPLQSPNGSLVPIVSPLTIPASGAAYISSTAISAPKVAIQLVNTGGCSTTNVEVTAVITNVSVSSPLISSTSANPSGVGTQVQGISPTGSSADLINPVLVSGGGPPVNGGFQVSGLDTFTPLAETKGFSGSGATLTLSKLPVPTQGINELGIMVASNINGSCGSKVFNPVWTNQGGIGGAGTIGFWTTFPSIGNTLFTEGITSGCTWSTNVALGTALNFNATTVVTASIGVACCAPAISAPNNPVGATIFIVVPCTTTTACGITSISDTLAMSWGQVETFFDGTISGTVSGITIWTNTSTNPGGADTVTITAFGSPATVSYMTLSGVTPSNLVQQQIPLEMDTLGGQVVREDALGSNQVACSVTLSTNTTTQLANCAQAGTVNGVPVRYYITDIQINTTTAGSATTIQLTSGTGVNCASTPKVLSQINYSNTTVGLQSVMGSRTPLVSPLQTAICATQAGTTAGTSVIELRGYLAP